MSGDLFCLRCGGSASIPLGAVCEDHSPIIALHDPLRVPAKCDCEIYSGSERNGQGFKVCERCGGHVHPVSP